VVQKLFFVVVFRVKGADDDGLAVEDANNNIITIFLSSSRKRKGKCLRSSKEVSLSLPLFSLSLSLSSIQKGVFLWLQKDLLSKDHKPFEKKNDTVKP